MYRDPPAELGVSRPSAEITNDLPGGPPPAPVAEELPTTRGSEAGPVTAGSNGQGSLDAPSAVAIPDRPSGVKSMAERYREMLSSMRLRITCGKSAIHGLGAITKAPHRAGEGAAPD